MKIYRMIALMTAFFYFSGISLVHATMNYDCLDSKGKFKSCHVAVENGNLVMQYSKSLSQLNKTIPGKNITGLTGGEYARRRVAESVAMGILLTPLALFALFSKKKRDQFGIQYKNDEGVSNVTMISTKKKYSLSLKTQLEGISGLTVQYAPAPEKKSKK